MRLAAVATGACLALVACGGDSGPDLDEIQNGLARDVEEVTGTRDVVVTCPDDVAEGDVCDVTAPGGVQARVRVTALDDDEVKGEIVPP